MTSVQKSQFSLCLVESLLTFPKRQPLDFSTLKEFADDNFKFDGNQGKFSERVENTVGKEEIARYEFSGYSDQNISEVCTINA